MMAINKRALVICKREISISADMAKVWSTLTNIDRWTSWNLEVSNVKLNGELKPKTTFDWKTGGAKIRSTIHTVEPYENFGWSGKAFGMYAIHNWTLIEANGQTKVLVEESMEGLLVRLFKNMLNKNLEKGMENWLNQLKQECER